nr:hypothetical protein [Tanacetum cinerariifolium]
MEILLESTSNKLMVGIRRALVMLEIMSRRFLLMLNLSDHREYKNVNINLEGRGVQMGDVHTTQQFEDSHVTLTLVNPDGQQQSSSVSSQFVTSMLNRTLDARIESIFKTTSQMDVQPPTTVAPLLLSEPTLTPSTIAIITTIQQAPTPPTTTPSTPLQDLPNFGLLFGSDHQLKTLRDEAQADNEEFLKTIDENMQKIIKEQVKEQAKVLTRSSNSSNTSYAVAADLSEIELKKILIEKKECNKSIHRSNEQRNLYKALINAYESNKIILETYGDTVTLKRRRDDDVKKDEEPSVGSERGSKRRRQGKEPESASAPKKKATRSTAFLMNQLKVDTLTLELLARPTYEPMKGSCKILVELEFFLKEFYKETTDQLDWINPEEQQYPHNLLKPLTMIPKSRGHHVILFDHFINNDLEYLCGGASSRKYTTSVTKTKEADYWHIKWIEDLVPQTMESARDVYSKHKIIAVTKLKIVEWHNYKHLDWITVQRDDDKLYKFKEGDFKRLHIQDIEDIIIIQRRVEDLELGVESYQKKLNLTRPDTYCSNLKRKEAYIAYSNPRGFIYQNKDKQNKLIRVDELHKFNDGTLIDVRTALDDRLKGIRMKYLPQTIWRKSDKERAAAMIQAIDKQLKTRRIMRSLERFIGGRLYEGDFWML